MIASLISAAGSARWAQPPRVKPRNTNRRALSKRAVAAGHLAEAELGVGSLTWLAACWTETAAEIDDAIFHAVLGRTWKGRDDV